MASRRWMRALSGAWLLGSSACGGAAPLLHPAHVLPPGEVTVGAGFSATMPTSEPAPGADEQVVDEAGVSEGLAPWVSARLGLEHALEAGLTYTGRAVRLDLRRAIELGTPTLSVGLGASGLLPKRREDLDLRVGGGGLDLPVLLGFVSDSDVYAGWIGARGGVELLRGHRELAVDPNDVSAPLTEDVNAWHLQGGGLVGFRVGFRHVFAALELEAAMHYADGEVGNRDVTIHRFTLSPAGALIVRF